MYSLGVPVNDTLFAQILDRVGQLRHPEPHDVLLYPTPALEVN